MTGKLLESRVFETLTESNKYRAKLLEIQKSLEAILMTPQAQIDDGLTSICVAAMGVLIAHEIEDITDVLGSGDDENTRENDLAAKRIQLAPYAREWPPGWVCVDHERMISDRAKQGELFK